ncbi:hypothetical protein [Phenylobacterium sp.]|jgi:hypothetical protein|uniref:hypothetical protein n=1 Tax=Phenylobacterium sp. TaxID=1871053 RepID=UPI002F9535C2
MKSVIELTTERAAARADLRLALLACVATVAVAPAVLAQTAPAAAAQSGANPSAAAPEDDVDAVVEELVVVAETREQPGAVVGDIPPEIQLGPREIRSLGVSSVAELLDALAPQIGSARGRGGGRPVTLVNGQRISSFAEIRDLPPEAILRVDILPEEVALKYGYRADQRVVNFVLRRRFNALTTEAGARVATAGGREAFDANANILRIQRDTRFQLDLKANRSTPLLESERDVLRSGAERPFALAGNVTAAPFGSGEIDPALTALAGQPLTVVGVPTTGSGLAAFAAQPAAATSEAPYRSLLSEQTGASVNAVLTRPLGEGIGATLNGRLETTQTESLQGLAGATLTVPAGSPFSPFSRAVEVQRFAGLTPLTRRNDVIDAHLGFSANGATSGWRWSVTANADRTQAETLTERGLNTSILQAAVTAGQVNPFAPLPSGLVFYRAPDQAKSVVTSADIEALAHGTLFDLPAGDVTAALTVGASTLDFASASLRSGVARDTDLGRDVGRVQANLDVPLTRRDAFLGGIGNLTLNFNAAAEKLSDFGTLTTLGGGINWSPFERFRVIASVTDEEGAPTVQQLGNPQIETENVRVFDYVRGETVEVTQVEGGNEDLLADSRRVFKLGLNWQPFQEQQLNFRADYTRSRIRDAIASFPAVTAEIERAFLNERIFRDGTGRLTRVDVRPVNFERQDSEQIRWGFNYSRPLRATRQPQFTPEEMRRFAERRARAQGQDARGQNAGSVAAPGAASPPGEAGAARGERGGGGQRQGFGGPGGGGFGGPGGGGFGGRGGGPGAGALQFALFHTWRLQEEIFIRPGVAPLDLLEGSAIGATGGTPRHEIEAQAGASRNGLGFRATVRWQSGTEVNGARFGGQELDFSDLTTVNVRLFADLGLQPWARGRSWLRGARATLSVDNLFDERLEVRDAQGLTPISYQPDLIDPLGRTVRLSFRKVFF